MFELVFDPQKGFCLRGLAHGPRVSWRFEVPGTEIVKMVTLMGVKARSEERALRVCFVSSSFCGGSSYFGWYQGSFLFFLGGESCVCFFLLFFPGKGRAREGGRVISGDVPGLHLWTTPGLRASFHTPPRTRNALLFAFFLGSSSFGLRTRASLFDFRVD